MLARIAFNALVSLLICLQRCAANVEKAIFLGPETVNIPHQHPTLEDLRVDTLTPGEWTLRTHISAAFPSADAKLGKTSWYLLSDLQQGQRYEVRICWAATQPTAFTLDTYELPVVWETSELITSLAEYSMSRQPDATADTERAPGVRRPATQKGETQASVLFLRVLAAADYFTTNATLMRDVPPVHVDIILDPFVLNVFPRSLLPTAGFVVVVAVASSFVAKLAVGWLRGVVAAAAAASADGVEGDAERKKRQ